MQPKLTKEQGFVRPKALKGGFMRKVEPRTARRRYQTGKTKVARNAGKSTMFYDLPKSKKFVIAELSRGVLLSNIIDVLRCSRWTIHRWADTDPEFARDFEEARLRQADAMADQVAEISDGTDELSRKTRSAIEKLAKQLRREKIPGWQQQIRTLESNLIARNRLQIEARRWHAKVTNPKRYGDKVDMSSSDGSMKPPPQMVVQFVSPDGRGKGSKSA